jgi:hypothetical protein
MRKNYRHAFNIEGPINTQRVKQTRQAKMISLNQCFSNWVSRHICVSPKFSRVSPKYNNALPMHLARANLIGARAKFFENKL